MTLAKWAMAFAGGALLTLAVIALSNREDGKFTRREQTLAVLLIPMLWPMIWLYIIANAIGWVVFGKPKVESKGDGRVGKADSEEG